MRGRIRYDTTIFAFGLIILVTVLNINNNISILNVDLQSATNQSNTLDVSTAVGTGNTLESPNVESSLRPSLDETFRDEDLSRTSDSSTGDLSSNEVTSSPSPLTVEDSNDETQSSSPQETVTPASSPTPMPTSQQKEVSSTPISMTLLNETDTIYSNMYYSPFVIPEYKLIFFTLPQVANTEWKFLIYHLLNGKPWPANETVGIIHNPNKNGLSLLLNYPLEEAQNMMNSDDWTRAIFVREPKSKIVGSFESKYVKEGGKYFINRCCNYLESADEQNLCRSKASSTDHSTKQLDFYYFLNLTSTICSDVQWDPQYTIMDEKWWPKVNFVGYMGTLLDDAEKLLKQLTSTKDGANAWTKLPGIGWDIHGTYGFIQASQESTELRRHLDSFFDARDEVFFEKQWSIDWNQPYYHFESIQLFKTYDDDNDDTTILDKNSVIYRDENRAPFVIPEYKLIFFPTPKVACTEFKLMMRELMDNPWPTNLDNGYLHDPHTNNLTTLKDYPVNEAQSMMNSKEWTKAVFVREPKERILSAFINKFVNDGFKYYNVKCCHHLKPESRKKECLDKIDLNMEDRVKEFSYFLSLSNECNDPHWSPQYNVMDDKWWPKADFVGYMGSIAQDTKRLLMKLKSTKDGVSAWEKHGKTGWGDNRTGGFMQENEAGHSTNAHEKLKKYYTAADEKFVDEHWAIEWSQSFYHFDKIQLYPEGVKSEITILDEDDLIYTDEFKSPFVVAEYKLIFFTVAKVACTEWKLLMRELMNDPWPEGRSYGDLHNPKTNKLSILKYYPRDEAQDMLNDDEWTKAVFVREPKERILSSFLNKYVKDGYKYFKDKCCAIIESEERAKECFNNVELGRWGKEKERDFSYFLSLTNECIDPHWEPQYNVMDEKWWPKVNFVGYMENVADDTKTLLTKLKSVIDDVSAWDRVGKTGWGEDKKDGFMQVNEAGHSTNAREKLKNYYTPEDEKFVNENWSIEWSQSFYHFDKMQIYSDEDIARIEAATSPEMTKLEKNDLVVGPVRSPYVVPEYKLIFFSVPKVACSEWKRLIYKLLMGKPWHEEFTIHDPNTNNLSTLMDFPLLEAQLMMNSDEWTKAIFVREPKERILSSFLNKYVKDGFKYFNVKCCKHIEPEERSDECLERTGLGRPRKKKEDEFSYFLSLTNECSDVHWQPQYNAMDEKWWPKVNFVGYMENVAEDTRKLLMKLKSTKDGVSAWDRAGKTGWGDNSTGGFMQENEAGHSTNAREKLKKYYTAADEKFVEEHWAIEWNQAFYHYDRMQLYSNNS